MTAQILYSETQPELALVNFFKRNGYKRIPSKIRREKEPSQYKKGYEIRLVANTSDELDAIRRLLSKAGLKGGRPFRKNNKWVQPIYGKQAMERFNKWLEDFG